MNLNNGIQAMAEDASLEPPTFQLNVTSGLTAQVFKHEARQLPAETASGRWTCLGGPCSVSRDEASFAKQEAIISGAAGRPCQLANFAISTLK